MKSREESIQDMAADVVCFNNRYLDSHTPMNSALSIEMFEELSQPSVPSLGLKIVLVHDLEYEASPFNMATQNHCADDSLSKEIVMLDQLSNVNLNGEAHFYSKWALQNIKNINKSLEVLFNGFEDEAMAQFAELEKRMGEKKNGEETVRTVKKKQHDGGARELKGLQVSIKYEGRNKKSKGNREELTITK